MSRLTVLCVGDVVGRDGVEYLSGGRLRRVRDEYSAHLVIVNGENSATYNGISPDSANDLLDAGADVITGGNHTFRKKNIGDYLDLHENVIRPANYPGDVQGNGYYIADCMGYRVLVISLLGTVYLDALDNPFSVSENILRSLRGKYDISVIDFHAEATSEKICLAKYLDGKVSCVFGTHTHVQTADATVLRGGTGYITDLGMTGSMNGVLGVRTDCIIHKFTKHTPVQFEPAEGDVSAHGAVFTFDTDTGKCVEAKAICF